MWNGLTFNFETILQAHDSPVFILYTCIKIMFDVHLVQVRTMQWSHNDVWMVTGDHAGYIKYWQSNMNNVKMFQVIRVCDVIDIINLLSGSQRGNQKSFFLSNGRQVCLLQ